MVVADAGRGDWILCQVTSNPYGDLRAVELTNASFAAGTLRVTSYARPGKLFTASSDLLVSAIGVLTADSRNGIAGAIIALLRAGDPTA